MPPVFSDVKSEKEIIEYLAIVELKWKEIPKYGYDYYYR